MLAKFSRVACVAGAKSPSPFDACFAGYSRVEWPKKREKTAFVLCSPTPLSERVKLGSFMSQGCNDGKEMYNIE